MELYVSTNSSSLLYNAPCKPLYNLEQSILKTGYWKNVLKQYHSETGNAGKKIYHTNNPALHVLGLYKTSLIF